MKKYFQKTLKNVPVIFVTGVLLGCGVKISGGTDHEVHGTAKVVLSVDFDICKQYVTIEKQEECIDKLLDLLATASELEQEANGIRGAE